MRVMLAQLQVAKVDETLDHRLEHIEKLINSEISNQKVDLVLLPESAFCSYCLGSVAQAKRIGLEQEPRVKAWGSMIAKRYQCHLAFGFVGCASATAKPRNALAVFNPEGELIYERIKRFLYDSDLVWTSERGGEFEAIELTAIEKSPKVMFAICNDINAFDFSEAEMASFPLASAAQKSRASVICLLPAWCSAHPDSPAWAHDEEIEVHSQLNYWLERLAPLNGTRTFFCAADLVGREAIPGKKARIRYCGSSCVLNLETGLPLQTPLDCHKEGVSVVDIPL